MNQASGLNEVAAETLVRIRERVPLVLSLTNSVVQPITANLLLAVGAAPVMLNDAEECEDLLRTCGNALLVNLGTLSREQADVMRRSADVANAGKIPWVLDPVAVGLLKFRTEFVQEILRANPTIIRGNGAEILALAGYDAKSRGPESTCGSDTAVCAAKELAAREKTTVLVTGEIDYVADSGNFSALENGHPLMTRVTGVGCAMGALTAACAAVADTPFHAAVASAALMGIAGEMAFEKSSSPGTFAVALLDALYEMTPDLVRTRTKLCGHS